MKKVHFFLTMVALCFSNVAGAMSSTIEVPVPNGGFVSPKGGILNVPLSGVIIDNVNYDLSCKVNNPNMPDVITMKVDVKNVFCDRTGCGGLLINGAYPVSNQVNLPKQENTVTFLKFQTAAYEKNGVASFQNLDTTATAIVSDCVASPSVK